MTVAAIIARASKVFGVPAISILSPNRDRHTVEARFAVMKVARDALGYSFPQIGTAMNRDHTTVMDGYRRAGEWSIEKPEYARKVERTYQFASIRRCPCCKQTLTGRG